jgi:hypothetical protein
MAGVNAQTTRMAHNTHTDMVTTRRSKHLHTRMARDIYTEMFTTRSSKRFHTRIAHYIYTEMVTNCRSKHESLTTDTQTDMVTIACYEYIHVQRSHE